MQWLKWHILCFVYLMEKTNKMRENAGGGRIWPAGRHSRPPARPCPGPPSAAARPLPLTSVSPSRPGAASGRREATLKTGLCFRTSGHVRPSRGARRAGRGRPRLGRTRSPRVRRLRAGSHPAGRQPGHDEGPGRPHPGVAARGPRTRTLAVRLHSKTLLAPSLCRFRRPGPCRILSLSPVGSAVLPASRHPEMTSGIFVRVTVHVRGTWQSQPESP